MAGMTGGISLSPSLAASDGRQEAAETGRPVASEAASAAALTALCGEARALFHLYFCQISYKRE